MIGLELILWELIGKKALSELTGGIAKEFAVNPLVDKLKKKYGKKIEEVFKQYFQRAIKNTLEECHVSFGVSETDNLDRYYRIYVQETEDENVLTQFPNIGPIDRMIDVASNDMKNVGIGTEVIILFKTKLMVKFDNFSDNPELKVFFVSIAENDESLRVIQHVYDILRRTKVTFLGELFDIGDLYIEMEAKKKNINIKKLCKALESENIIQLVGSFFNNRFRGAPNVVVVSAPHGFGKTFFSKKIASMVAHDFIEANGNVLPSYFDLSKIIDMRRLRKEYEKNDFVNISSQRKLYVFDGLDVQLHGSNFTDILEFIDDLLYSTSNVQVIVAATSPLHRLFIERLEQWTDGEYVEIVGFIDSIDSFFEKLSICGDQYLSWSSEISVDNLLSIGFQKSDLELPYNIEHISELYRNLSLLSVRIKEPSVTELYLLFSNRIFKAQERGLIHQRLVLLHFVAAENMGKDSGCGRSVEYIKKWISPNFAEYLSTRGVDIANSFNEHLFDLRGDQYVLKQEQCREYYVAEYLFLTWLSICICSYTEYTSSAIDLHIGIISESSVKHLACLVELMFGDASKIPGCGYVFSLIRTIIKSDNVNNVFECDDEKNIKRIKPLILSECLEKTTNILFELNYTTQDFDMFSGRCGSVLDYYEKYILLLFCTLVFENSKCHENGEQGFYLEEYAYRSKQAQLFENMLRGIRSMPVWTGKLFSGGNFNGADLSGCSFAGIYLSKASFEDAILVNVSFSNVIMNSAYIANNTMQHVYMKNVEMQRSELVDIVLENITFVNCDFSDTAFRRSAILNGLICNSAFIKSKFYDCSMDDICFVKTSFIGNEFYDPAVKEIGETEEYCPELTVIKDCSFVNSEFDIVSASYLDEQQVSIF